MKKLIVILLLINGVFSAQSVRSLNNTGVDKYDEDSFSDAEVNFKKAIEENAETFEAHYNLGSSLYKQERYDEAIKSYQSALAVAETDAQKSQIFYNQGNALLKGQKIQESIEAYKEALKINPGDLEAKYNLSYALEMLKNQQNQQQQNQNNQDQNQDQNNDQQQNQDQQNKDQNKDQQNQNKQNQQNQDQKKQDQQNQQQQQQQQNKDQISKEEAQRILQALKNNEADLQKELRKKKGKATKSAKDW